MYIKVPVEANDVVRHAEKKGAAAAVGKECGGRVLEKEADLRRRGMPVRPASDHVHYKT